MGSHSSRKPKLIIKEIHDVCMISLPELNIMCQHRKKGPKFNLVNSVLEGNFFLSYTSRRANTVVEFNPPIAYPSFLKVNNTLRRAKFIYNFKTFICN